MFFTLTDILTRRAVFHIEKNTDNRVTAAITKEAEKEEKPLTFKLAGEKVDLTKIAAIILISLMIIYAVLRVARGRITGTRKRR